MRDRSTPTPDNHAGGSLREARCPQCGKRVALRKNGTFWKHRDDPMTGIMRSASIEAGLGDPPYGVLCDRSGKRP